MTNEMIENTLYWTRLRHGRHEWIAAAGPGGPCYVGGWDEPEETFRSWARRRMPEARLTYAEPSGAEPLNGLKRFAEELTSYIQGEAARFDAAYKLPGTEFQQVVWKALCHIPYGETRTYSEIAAAVGRPDAVRAVAAAIGANPLLVAVPCHRVVGKDGSLTGYRGGLPMKRRLLELEGAWGQSKAKQLISAPKRAETQACAFRPLPRASAPAVVPKDRAR